MNSILRTLSAYFAQCSQIQIALVFGSFAKERQTAQSDVDIAISCGAPLTSDNKLKFISELSDLTGRTIDLVDLESVHGVILGEALAGKRLKLNDPYAFAKLLKRHWLDDADFGPLRRRILKHRRESYFGK